MTGNERTGVDAVILVLSQPFAWVVGAWAHVFRECAALPTNPQRQESVASASGNVDLEPKVLDAHPLVPIANLDPRRTVTKLSIDAFDVETRRLNKVRIG